MALSATMTWEVRTTGSDNSAGGFAGDSSLATPSAPVVTGSATGGTVAAATYYCVVCYKGPQGEGQKSAESSVTVSGATSKFTVTALTASTTGLYGGAVTWALHVGTTSGGPYFVQGTDLVLGTDRAVTTTPPTSGTQPFGTDRSQQDSAQVAIDNGAITTSITANVITFTGYVPTSADVGNVVNMLTGTNVTAGPYQITGWTSTTWTVTGAATMPTSGTTTDATGNMGGAMATPGKVFASAVASGNICHVKSGTYTFTSSSNVAGGRITPPAGAGGLYTLIWGYTTTRGDNGTKPIFQPSAGSITLVTLSGASSRIENIEFQANAQSSTVGINTSGNNNQVIGCTFTSVDKAIDISGNSTLLERCLATGCTSSGNAIFYFSSGAGSLALNCVVSGGSGIPFRSNVATGLKLERCIATSGTAGSGAFQMGTNSGWVLLNCIAYNFVTAGAVCFDLAGNGRAINCIGMKAATSKTIYSGTTIYQRGVELINCAAWTAGVSGASTYANVQATSFVTLTADPFTDAANGNFSLNNTAGGGAALRALGYPSSYVGLSGTSYPDIGAYQHADPTQPSASDVRAGTAYNDGATTGTLTVTSARSASSIAFGTTSPLTV